MVLAKFQFFFIIYENMIRMFVSTQPILLKYNDLSTSFIDIIKKNKNLLIDIYNNQDVSFSELSNSLKLINVNNLFVFLTIVESNINNTLSSENNNNDNLFEMNELLEELNKNNNSKFDILLIVYEREDGYSLSIDYNYNSYDYYIVNNIINSYIEVLNNINHFNEKIMDIEYIPIDEKENIINKFNYDTNNYQCNDFYHT